MMDPRHCPFCGSPMVNVIGKHATSAYAYHTSHKPKFSVRCVACRARGPIKRTEDDAVVAWNGKAALSSLPLLR